MHKIISQNLDTIVQICEKYNVSRLYVFGSVVTERFSDESSDLDLLVELEPMPFIDRGENLIQFWDEVETLFNVMFQNIGRMFGFSDNLWIFI